MGSWNRGCNSLCFIDCQWLSGCKGVAICDRKLVAGNVSSFSNGCRHCVWEGGQTASDDLEMGFSTSFSSVLINVYWFYIVC